MWFFYKLHTLFFYYRQQMSVYRHFLTRHVMQIKVLTGKSEKGGDVQDDDSMNSLRNAKIQI